MNFYGLAPIKKLDIGILRQRLNNDNINTDDNQISNQKIELLPKILVKYLINYFLFLIKPKEKKKKVLQIIF